MAIPPPIIPVPELIRAARTSAGLQRHAIPNVAIPIRIKTTAHTCELIAFKLSTNPMTTPGCLRDSQHLEFATSTSTQHQPFANALECFTSTLLCVLLGAALSIAQRWRCINASREMYTPRLAAPHWTSPHCRNAIRSYSPRLHTHSYSGCPGMPADGSILDCLSH